MIKKKPYNELFLMNQNSYLSTMPIALLFILELRWFQIKTKVA